MIPLLLLSGMSRGDRLFSHLLPLIPNASVIPWIEPTPRESVESYADRMAESLRSMGPCFIGGVSFGGIVAVEVAHRLAARCCFVISSIRHPRELPPWLRVWRALPNRQMESILGSAGYLATAVPRVVRTRSTARLTKLAGPAGAWHRWSTAAVLRWTPQSRPMQSPILQIHGDADATFPVRFTRPDFVIRGGGHVLPVTHAQTLANYLCAAMDYMDGDPQPTSSAQQSDRTDPSDPTDQSDPACKGPAGTSPPRLSANR